MSAKKIKKVHVQRDYIAYAREHRRQTIVAMGASFLVLFTGIVLLTTHAATPTISVEIEAGQITGNAKTFNDTSASGGRAVQFGTGVTPPPPPPPGAYNPDQYCQFHVMGSLYGDGGGNGAANGAQWSNTNTSWSLSNGSTAVVDRFERCAKYVKANNIGGNGVATVSRSSNSVALTNYWPAGRNLPFYDGAMTPVVTSASALAKRAFLMSVIEGEGEPCDPKGGSCATAQIADNYKTLSGGTNPLYYQHITALRQVAIDAGLTTAFNATGNGCTPQTDAQLVSGGGAALCIKSSDYQVIKNWPVAACGRVPGYGYATGYQCGKPDAP